MTSCAAAICAFNPPSIWRQVAQRLCRFPFSGVVVVDDGSSPPLQDPTSREQGTPFRLLRSDENIGLAAARNLALGQIEADWILFVDADVVPSEQFLSDLPTKLASTAADGLGFHVREHNRDSDWDFYRAVERERNKLAGKIEWVSGLLCAYRVAALREVGGFDPAFRTNSEDVDLGYRLTRAGLQLEQIPDVCGEHHRKDSLRSFLRMHHRYAVTAKRVDRSRYFPQEKNSAAAPPLFHLASIRSQLRMMLSFLWERPRAFYLPPLVLAAMLLGASKGRREASQNR